MSKIHQVSSGGEYDKRFYVPGVVIARPCSCGHTMTWDGEDNYLSYPGVGEPIKIDLYCSECAEYQEVTVVLNMTVTEIDFDD